MKDKDRLHDELKKHAPFLNDLRKNGSGMRIPESYLDDLEASVFGQLEAIGARRKPLQAPPKPSLWQRLQSLWSPRVLLALTGALALAFTAWRYYCLPPANASADESVIAGSSITPEDATAYLLKNWSDLEPEQLALALPPDELPLITLDGPNTNGQDQEPAQPIELRTEDLNKLLQEMTEEELNDLLLNI